MTFAQRRNRLTTHFSECIPVVKRRMTVLKRILLDFWTGAECKYEDTRQMHTQNSYSSIFLASVYIYNPDGY